MNHTAAISRFMVAAGAFAVGGTQRTAEEAARLGREMEAVKPLLDAPADKAVASAVKRICDFGVNDKTIDRLMNALAARQAAIVNAASGAAADAHPPRAASATVAMSRSDHAAVMGRLPYKDD